MIMFLRKFNKKIPVEVILGHNFRKASGYRKLKLIVFTETIQNIISSNIVITNLRTITKIVIYVLCRFQMMKDVCKNPSNLRFLDYEGYYFI